MSDLSPDQIKHSITEFDTLIGDTTTNKADIASHYNHSPERHRLYINGKRFQLQYNSTPKFTEGTGNNERRSGEGRVRKRNIYNGDVAIILAKAGTATDITFEYNTEQDW